jgi:hypothetical protein
MHLLVATGLLDLGVAVGAIAGSSDVVAVHAEVNVVPVEHVELGCVGRISHNLIDPFAGFDGGVSAQSNSGQRDSIEQPLAAVMWTWVRKNANLSSSFITGGPLFFVISASLCTPTTR